MALDFWNDWKRKRERLYRKYLSIYESINNEYNLKLPYHAYEPPAWQNADREAKTNFFYQLTSSPGNAITMIVAVVIAVVNLIVTYGTNAATSAQIIAAAVAAIGAGAMAAYSINTRYNVAPKLEQAYSDITQGHYGLSWRVQSREQDSKKVQLTQALMFGGYDIYANGSIFKQNGAGSQTNSPQKPLDTAKGVLGEVSKDEVDEQIQTRSHKNLGGNVGFFGELVAFNEVPSATFELPVKDQIFQKNIQIKKNVVRISEGFAALAENKFNVIDTLHFWYCHTFKEQITPFYKHIMTLDFLDKNKNYNRALRLDFRYKRLKDFPFPDDPSEAEKRQYKYEKLLNLVNNTNEKLEIRASAYLDLIRGFFRRIVDLATTPEDENELFVYEYFESEAKVQDIFSNNIKYIDIKNNKSLLKYIDQYSSNGEAYTSQYGLYLPSLKIGKKANLESLADIEPFEIYKEALGEKCENSRLIEIYSQIQSKDFAPFSRVFKGGSSYEVVSTETSRSGFNSQTIYKVKVNRGSYADFYPLNEKFALVIAENDSILKDDLRELLKGDLASFDFDSIYKTQLNFESEEEQKENGRLKEQSEYEAALEKEAKEAQEKEAKEQEQG